MPFGSFFKKVFKKKAGEIAEDLGGAAAKDFVEDNIDQIQIDENESGLDGILQSFTGNQQSGLQSLFG